jgi:hypothetical protein
LETYPNVTCTPDALDDPDVAYATDARNDVIGEHV